MNNLTKFGLSIVLGLTAAALNWMWLSAEKTPPAFVGIRQQTEQGEEISKKHLMSVPVPGDEKTLSRSLIPWRDRAILLGSNAARDYVVGDVVLYRDIKAPLEQPEWDIVGPFQLISVGAQFKENVDGGEGVSSTRGNTITIAVDPSFDGRTSRLLQVLDADTKNTRKGDLRIVAVQVMPSVKQMAGPTTAPGEVVYQTVSLSGIPNVPRVLLEGDMIRFVIPKEIVL